MISNLYRGSVKDVVGPFQLPAAPGKTAILFEYTDSFSVFDWGKMPDVLPAKGSALAILAADLFEKLENPETWRDFSKSSVALALRKANRYGSLFNEIGEQLQAEKARSNGKTFSTPGRSKGFCRQANAEFGIGSDGSRLWPGSKCFPSSFDSA